MMCSVVKYQAGGFSKPSPLLIANAVGFLVLVTNLREFGLVGPDSDGGETMLESFRLAESEEVFARRLENPRA